jgi:hypothetical protein
VTTTDPTTDRPTEPPRSSQRTRSSGGGSGTGGGRRLWPAGYAFLILLGALIIGSFLNAQGLRKTAYNMEPGIGRDLAMALTKPLVEVSAFLRLDRPRQGIQEVIGRGGADTIDTAVVVFPVTPDENVGTETTATPGATTEGAGGTAPGDTGGASTGKGEAEPTPAKEAFTPRKRLRVWVAGDSLAITPGQSIERILGANRAINPLGVDGRVSTGLERPDVFNWFTHIPQELRRLDPKVVVLAFGANDDHGYMTGLPEGVDVDDFATKAWVKEYRRRVGGVMDTITRDGRLLIWIGVPITRSPEQSERFRVLNTVYQTEAAKRPGKVFFVNTYRLFQDDKGNYADYLPKPNGELVHVRAPDGVHFQPEGGDWIAREVLRDIREVYDVTSWKKKRQEQDDAQSSPNE